MRQSCNLSAHRHGRRTVPQVCTPSKLGGTLQARSGYHGRFSAPTHEAEHGHSDPRCLKTQAVSQEEDCPQTTRRQILNAAVSASISTQLLCSRSAQAEEAGELSSTSSPTAVLPNPQKIEDFDFYFIAPVGYKFINTQAPRPERGPAPEQSPMRARLDSPDGYASLSVIVRNSQVIKSTFFQVNDISVYGSILEAASLLLPRGSTLLSTSSETIMLPAKDTPLGSVQPSNTYYRYEFLTTNGLHAFLSAAAQRGRVYICGATTSKSAWEPYKDQVVPAVLSFRLKQSALGPRG